MITQLKTTLWLCFAAFCLPATASQYKIGLSVWSGFPDSVAGFKQALADNGFKEGDNVVYVLKDAHSDTARQKQMFLLPPQVP
jgi:ABC-type uncharacterized transport system substrate-binding protein